MFKAGNFHSFPSQFYFWKRMYLERKYLSHDKSQGAPMFCYAYRAFLDAMRDKDLKTLKKMTEPALYQRLHSNFKLMDNHKC